MPSYEPPTSTLFTVETTHNPPATRPTSHSFSLHRPNLTHDTKKTRNAKRLSLVVPPSPGMLETFGIVSTPSFPPTSSSFATRRPFTPASRMPTISASSPSSTAAASETSGMTPSTNVSATTTTTTVATTNRRHSQFMLENALPTPRFPVANVTKARRPISAYFSDFSVECGTASPYTSEPVCILPHLYLGAEHNASDTIVLSRLGINHVLNVAVEIAQSQAEDEAHAAARAGSTPTATRNSENKNGIQYQHLSWTHHHKNLSSEFPEAFNYIENARSTGGKILVHCQLGVSRSASLVIAYVMKTENKTLTEAYDYVKDRSAVISPNMSFMYQLAEFETLIRNVPGDQGSRGGASVKRNNRIFDQEEDEEPYHGGFPPEEDMDMDSSEQHVRPTTPAVATASSSKRNSLALGSFGNTSTIRSGCPSLASTTLPSSALTEQKTFKPLTRPRSTYHHSLLGAEAAASVATYVAPRTPLVDKFSFERSSLVYPPLSAIGGGNNSNKSQMPSNLTTVEASSTTPAFVATDFASIGSTPFNETPLSSASLRSSGSMSSRPSSTTSATTSSTLSTDMGGFASFKVIEQKDSSVLTAFPCHPSPVTSATVIVPRRGSRSSTTADRDSNVSPRRSGSWTTIAGGQPSMMPNLSSTWEKCNGINCLGLVGSNNNDNISGDPSHRRRHRASLTAQIGSQLEGYCRGGIDRMVDVVDKGDVQDSSHSIPMRSNNSMDIGNAATTATTSTTTTTNSIAGGTPEFIFSPRPCSPPLLES
ncbi:Dual specificity protein phosphatase 10, partial [Podila humilis]